MVQAEAKHNMAECNIVSTYLLGDRELITAIGLLIRWGWEREREIRKMKNGIRNEGLDTPSFRHSRYHTKLKKLHFFTRDSQSHKLHFFTRDSQSHKLHFFTRDSQSHKLHKKTKNGWGEKRKMNYRAGTGK